MCLSCGSSTTCGCGVSTIMMPVVKGDQGDTGLTGSTGPTGPAGAGALNATKKFVDQFVYTGAGTPTLTITRATLEDSALLSNYGYSADSNAIVTPIFGTPACIVLNLRIYVAGPNAGEFWDITNLVAPRDIKYSTTGIIIYWDLIVPKAQTYFNFTGNITFYVVIIG